MVLAAAKMVTASSAAAGRNTLVAVADPDGLILELAERNNRAEREVAVARGSGPDLLISAVDRGIYVATFNYCRVLDPKSLGVTGLTRNGTFMIENGEITGAITNMRFTQSFVDALGPGRILGLGDDARLANSEFGSAMMHVPSMRLAGWQFTGGAEG